MLIKLSDKNNSGMCAVNVFVHAHIVRALNVPTDAVYICTRKSAVVIAERKIDMITRGRC